MKERKHLTARPRCTATGALLYLAAALIACLLDRWSKAAVLKNIPLGGSAEGIPGLFRLTYVRNTGAAWSMLSGKTDLLAIVSAVAMIGIAFYLLYGKLCPQARFCLALVLGGAAGNFIDRVQLHYVVDMIDLSFIRFPVFNVGDSFIVTGGILFAVLYLFYNDRWLAAHGILPAPEEHDEHDPDA